MTILAFEIAGRRLQIDSQKGFDLSLPFCFAGEGLTAFGAPQPGAETYRVRDFIGNTREGGSCNVQRLSLIPHCQGTHTECVGHLLDEPVSVCELLQDSWIPATLLSVKTEAVSESSGDYRPKPEAQDVWITKAAFEEAIASFPNRSFHEALILRTLPNEASKRTRRYTDAAYFSNDAMEEIVRHEVRHLLVDLPSIDRLDDGG
ncbi:MAG: cyclase family protein, partial [Gammaproteobacteria bacterium]